MGKRKEINDWTKIVLYIAHLIAIHLFGSIVLLHFSLSLASSPSCFSFENITLVFMQPLYIYLSTVFKAAIRELSPDSAVPLYGAL